MNDTVQVGEDEVKEETKKGRVRTHMALLAKIKTLAFTWNEVESHLRVYLKKKIYIYTYIFIEV